MKPPGRAPSKPSSAIMSDLPTFRHAGVPRQVNSPGDAPRKRSLQYYRARRPLHRDLVLLTTTTMSHPINASARSYPKDVKADGSANNGNRRNRYVRVSKAPVRHVGGEAIRAKSVGMTAQRSNCGSSLRHAFPATRELGMYGTLRCSRTAAKAFRASRQFPRKNKVAG